MRYEDQMLIEIAKTKGMIERYKILVRFRVGGYSEYITNKRLLARYENKLIHLEDELRMYFRRRDYNLDALAFGSNNDDDYYANEIKRNGYIKGYKF